MSKKKQFTINEAKKIGNTLGTKWNRFDVEQFRMGLNVELEHGTRDPSTNVTDNDPVLTGKIALAHLNEFPTTTPVYRKWSGKRKNRLAKSFGGVRPHCPGKILRCIVQVEKGTLCQNQKCAIPNESLAMKHNHNHDNLPRPAHNSCPFALNSLIPRPPPCASRGLSI